MTIGFAGNAIFHLESAGPKELPKGYDITFFLERSQRKGLTSRDLAGAAMGHFAEVE
jgi:hypothetical protein